jgi:hypothetical protein
MWTANCSGPPRYDCMNSTRTSTHSSINQATCCDAFFLLADFDLVMGPVHSAYNPSFSAYFFSQNSIFLSQQIRQQCFSAGLSAQQNGPWWCAPHMLPVYCTYTQRPYWFLLDQHRGMHAMGYLKSRLGSMMRRPILQALLPRYTAAPMLPMPIRCETETQQWELRNENGYNR